MTLTVVLVCAAFLLALAPLAVAIGGVKASSRLIYGASLAASGLRWLRLSHTFSPRLPPKPSHCRSAFPGSARTFV